MSKKSELVEVKFIIGLKTRSRGRFAEYFCEQALEALTTAIERQRPSWKITWEKKVLK